MGPELLLPVIVALLWGPTALWFAYRFLRRHRGPGEAETSTGVAELVSSSQLARGEILALIESDGFWICGTCRSLNRREAIRCYSCRTPTSTPARQAPAQAPAQAQAPLPVSRGVPVMAEGVAAGRTGPAPLPVSRGVPVMAEGVAAGRTALAQPPAPLPVHADGVGHISGEAAVMASARAAVGSARPQPDVRSPAPDNAELAALPMAPASAATCPFLGLRDDPSTQYDFPDPGNFCHAATGRGAQAAAPATRRMFVGMAGVRRPQPIGLDHQNARCLTATHQQCPLYPAVDTVEANR